MTTASHNVVVHAQYDARSQAYLQSSVHAQGHDLDALAALVQQAAAGRTDLRALDVGCGGGHVSFRLAPLVGEVVACDLTPAMLDTVAGEARARGLVNVQTCQASADTLPFDDASFDVVATRYSAHHWHAWRQGLTEMARVLHPGGLACFSDVVSPSHPLLATWLQSLELLRDPSHVRNASVPEWLAALSDVGLQIETVRHDRLRLDFASWIARMQTPDTHVAAIRSLQGRAADVVRQHFHVEADGSFTVDTALIVARKA
jgi:ubiquinone/menaquinone biosynthesis C-methylase UbiE